MNKNSKIYIAGHRGLVGSALVRVLTASGYSNILRIPSGELDLTRQSNVEAFLAKEKPEAVVIAAAKVGGILANSTYPAEFILKNLQIETNLIEASFKVNVKRLIFLGSSCIYPKFCPQPIREDSLMTGALEHTNQAYAIAKIAGVELCRAFNQQYGTQYLAVMPCNLYGPGDNYDLQNSHVLPALIRKMDEAKKRGSTVTLWGTGAVRREFLYSDDLAYAIVSLLELEDSRFLELIGESNIFPLINVGAGTDITILQLADMIKEVVGYLGPFNWDQSKPDGTYQKLLNSNRIRTIGWKPKFSLKEGIQKAYAAYLKETS